MSSGPSSSPRTRDRRLEVRLSTVTRFASVVSAPQHVHVRSSLPISAAQWLQKPTIFVTCGSLAGRQGVDMIPAFAGVTVKPRAIARTTRTPEG